MCSRQTSGGLQRCCEITIPDPDGLLKTRHSLGSSRATPRQVHLPVYISPAFKEYRWRVAYPSSSFLRLWASRESFEKIR